MIVGLTLLTICLVRSRRRHEFTAERATVLWATSLYWHFVDIVWVILFFLVYVL